MPTRLLTCLFALWLGACASTAPRSSAPPTFLLGRFRYPYFRSSLETPLGALGYHVVPKFGPGVEVLVLGDDVVNETGDGFVPVTDLPEYRQAQELGVEMIPLRKLRASLQPLMR